MKVHLHVSDQILTNISRFDDIKLDIKRIMKMKRDGWEWFRGYYRVFEYMM